MSTFARKRNLNATCGAIKYPRPCSSLPASKCSSSHKAHPRFAADRLRHPLKFALVTPLLASLNGLSDLPPATHLTPITNTRTQSIELSCFASVNMQSSHRSPPASLTHKQSSQSPFLSISAGVFLVLFPYLISFSLRSTDDLIFSLLGAVLIPLLPFLRVWFSFPSCNPVSILVAQIPSVIASTVVIFFLEWPGCARFAYSHAHCSAAALLPSSSRVSKYLHTPSMGVEPSCLCAALRRRSRRRRRQRRVIE